jgi:hypothetical protein
MGKMIELSSEVLFRELQGEAVLLDLKSQRYFGLDETGTRIWQLIQEHGEVREVVRRMLEEFDVEREVLEGDVERFLEELAQARLVSVKDDASEPVREDRGDAR